MSQSLEEYVSNSQLSQTYTVKKNNLAVLSYTLNVTNRKLNGFRISKSLRVVFFKAHLLRSLKYLIASDSLDIEKTDQLDKSTQTSALIDLNLVGLKQSNQINDLDPSTRISFIVYKSSILFDLNSSRIQSDEHNDCTNINSDQIVSNVVSITTNRLLTSSKPFVKTQFKHIAVISDAFFVLQVHNIQIFNFFIQL